MFTFNNTVTITRGASYSTTVIASLQVYIYEPTEEQDAINGVDGGQIEDRMITIYAWLKEGDKVTTALPTYDSGNTSIPSIAERTPFTTVALPPNFSIVSTCQSPRSL